MEINRKKQSSGEKKEKKKYESKRNRFKQKYKSTNEYKTGNRDKSTKSIYSKRSRTSRRSSHSRSPSSRKPKLPKYLTRKNSKFNQTAGSIKTMTNFPKVNYILKNVLLVGKWNEKRKKVYMSFAKKFNKHHLVVIFKNKNGHDCLGIFSTL